MNNTAEIIHMQRRKKNITFTRGIEWLMLKNMKHQPKHQPILIDSVGNSAQKAFA